MPTWSELLEELKGQPADSSATLNRKLHEYTGRVGDLTGRNVLHYASGFLQKPSLSGLLTSINPKDINGFMAGVHGLDPKKGLLLMLHTPGGVVEASQTIVGHLRSKFDVIDALIPIYGMSAGTMIALGCDSISMGCHSQLGPIDPQLNVGNKQYSAHSVVSQFEGAKKDILADPNLAHAWNPVLSTLGPALLQQARRAIRYGESLVAKWLEKHMFAGRPDAASRHSCRYLHRQRQEQDALQRLASIEFAVALEPACRRSGARRYRLCQVHASAHRPCRLECKTQGWSMGTRLSEGPTCFPGTELDFRQARRNAPETEDSDIDARSMMTASLQFPARRIRSTAKRNGFRISCVSNRLPNTHPAV